VNVKCNAINAMASSSESNRSLLLNMDEMMAISNIGLLLCSRQWCSGRPIVLYSNFV